MTTHHHAELVRSLSVRAYVFDPESECEVRDSYFERLGIDDARELVRLAYNRPAEAIEQVFIVRADFMTHEAQNALLKVLEEAPEGTRFRFVLPPDFAVLPTLQSRFSAVAVGEGESDLTEVFETFLAGSYKERLAAVESAAKKKDVAWQRSIKQGLIEHTASAEMALTARVELEFVARTLLTRGASNKMLLEQAALTLPLV